MENQIIIDAILEFHTWYEKLPSVTDLTTLDYSFEHGHISVEEFEKGEREVREHIALVSEKFGGYEKFFDLDLPFYYSFLDRLKKFGEAIDESDTNQTISNPGFTKALISDVLKSISDPESRKRERIWIFVRIGGFLKDFPNLK